RHAQRQVRARRTVLVLVAPVLAALRLVVPAILEVEQRRQLVVRDDDDAAAVAAIAARRSAAWYTILAPERRGAIAAVSCLDVDDGFVDELHGGTDTYGRCTAVVKVMRWADVWTRAVILPAWRRAVAVWVGCAIVAVVLFGPTGMQPEDLTHLALHHVGVGAV